MKSKMSNRERMTATFKHQETDYTPLHLEINQSYEYHDIARHWRNQFERIDFLLGLGVDAAIELWLPDPSFHPDVKVYEWREIRGNDTCICKQYDTPAGTLRQVIKETEDLYDYWHINKNTLGRMHSRIGGVGLLEDINPSRTVEYLINGPEDLEKMKHLFQPLSGILLEKWKEAAAYCKKQADEREVIYLARRLHCGSDMIWLTDPMASMCSFINDPGYMEEFLDIIEKWQLSNLGLALDAGVDVVTRFGYYDIPDFWGIDPFERYLAPKINKEAGICHEAGVFLSQQQSEGITQQLDAWKKIDIDILRDIDPVLGKEDMPRLKKELGGRVTFFGGINLIDYSLSNLTDESTLDVDAMVKKAFDELGKGGGFVLYPVTGVYVEVRWDDVLKMIEAWKRYR